MKKILQKIFNIQKIETYKKTKQRVEVHKVITLLGIKLKIKVYEFYKPSNDWFINYIDFSWQTLQNTHLFNDFYRNIQNIELAAITSGTPIPPKILLIIISMFIVDLSYSKANYWINYYLNNYGESQLHEYLVIADYCFKNNIVINQKIKNAATLYNILLKAEKNNELIKFITGKTCAIVGNGPSEIGKNKQNEIDNHEVVVRFNDFPDNNTFVNDYGKKTTIWSIGLLHNIEAIENKLKNFPDIKYLVFGIPMKYRTFSEEFVKKVLELKDKYHINIVSMDSQAIGVASDLINTNFPTAGFVWCNFVKKILGKGNFDTYGFNFLDTNPQHNVLDRYFENKTEEIRHSWHNYDQEKEYLKTIYF